MKEQHGKKQEEKKLTEAEKALRKRAKELWNSIEKEYADEGGIIKALEKKIEILDVSPSTWSDLDWGYRNDTQEWGQWKHCKKYVNPPGSSLKSLTEEYYPDLEKFVNGNINDVQQTNRVNRYEKVENSIRRIMEYLSINPNDHYFGKKVEPKKSFNSKSTFDPESDFSGCKWTVFFLYYRHDGYKSEPLIGVGTMEIDENGDVYFKNTGDDNSKDYNGSYEADNHKIDNGVVRFDLDSGGYGRHLHIKVHIKTPRQDIAVGQYVTFENNKVQSGRLVLARRNFTGDFYHPPNGHYSVSENPIEFKEIHPKVKGFLSLRVENYQIVQSHTTDLKSFDRKDRYIAKDNLFLEDPRPLLVMATAIKEYTKEKKDVVAEIQELFEGYKELRVKKIPALERGKHKVYTKAAEDVEQLKRARYFVFISEGVHNISFEYLRLAWALIYVKKVIIIGPADDFSGLIRGAKYQFVEDLIDEQSLTQRWKEGTLKENLQSIINHDLYGKLQLSEGDALETLDS